MVPDSSPKPWSVEDRASEWASDAASIRWVSFTAIRMAVGRVVLVAGVLILLFIPYLLWGTGLITAHSQALLRTEFAIAQSRSGAPTSTHLSAPPHGTARLTAHTAPNIADPPVGSAVGAILIPKIGLSMIVVEGTGVPQLQAGPGHYPSTPLPGEAGNAAIAGHRTTYLHPFYNLNELVPGDPITIETVQGIFLYDVTSSMAVLPTDVAVVDPTPTPTLTLTTCNPRYSASQRLVVHAALVASVLAHSKVAPVAPPASPTRAVQTTPQHDWLAAIVWAVGVIALTTAIWIGARRTRRGWRWLEIGVGVGVWLVVVFFFFQSVAPLLPASY
jgi:sortase A